MTIRSLLRDVRRLAAGVGVVHCPCGAVLPLELLSARPAGIVEELALPDELEALEPLATPEEARELQDVLNRGLELLPDADADDWRFQFADSMNGNGPRCPDCGDPVDTGREVSFISVSGPAPDGLLDPLAADPLLALPFAALVSTLRQRAAG